MNSYEFPKAVRTPLKYQIKYLPDEFEAAIEI
jgi:hypothetical protein